MSSRLQIKDVSKSLIVLSNIWLKNSMCLVSSLWILFWVYFPILRRYLKLAMTGYEWIPLNNVLNWIELVFLWTSLSIRLSLLDSSRQTGLPTIIEQTQSDYNFTLFLFFFVLISWIRSTIFSHQYGFRKHPTTCLAMIQVVIENITSVLVKEKMNLLSPAFLLSKKFFLLSLMIYAELP